MKISQYLQVCVVSCFAFVVGGCASNELVKKEESARPTIATVSPTKETKKTMESGTPANPVTKSERNSSEIKRSANDIALASGNSSKLIKGLESIYFDFDSSDLSKDARETLNKNAGVLMKEGKAIQVRIEGNCDDRGSAEYNLALGERRANAAAKYLSTLGVDAERISTVSYGKERPAAQGNTEEAMSKNRRDEFVVVK